MMDSDLVWVIFLELTLVILLEREIEGKWKGGRDGGPAKARFPHYTTYCSVHDVAHVVL